MVALAALSLAGIGCGAAPEEFDENAEYDENGEIVDVGSDEQTKEVDLAGLTGINGLLSMNGLTSTNGLTALNGLTAMNGLVSMNGLTAINGLTSVNGLTSLNGLVSINGLTSMNGSNYFIIPNGGDMMKTAAGRSNAAYMIRCALRSDQSITRKDQNNVSYTFQGKHGLADYWLSGATGTASGTCGLECQEWVSACMMAHYNPYGDNIPIMMVASHSRIGWGNPNKTYYDEPEAAWYGNLFSNPPRANYCDYLGESDERPGCMGTSSCVIKRADDYCQSGTDRMIQATGVERNDVAVLNSTNCKDGICSATKLLGYNCHGDDCAAEFTRPIFTWVNSDLMEQLY